MQYFHQALGLFTLILCGCLVSCKGPIVIQDCLQAQKLAADYAKSYSPHHMQRGWYGPPPVVSPPLRRAHLQQQAILLGHVDRLGSDGTVSPQPGARVFARQQFTDTDSHGNYTLPLATGTYTLRCGAVGLLVPQEPVALHVRPGDSIRINFLLLVDPRPIIHQMP
ncbi:hypothetical protein SAMN06265337_1359 [Hymenobacter gelipurpurascens]|uniref:Carboxypeptidase regulatory-like domain-containing protein n=1 Tax=Hymenobacter gelipurpurascens TaxID=89968 RepID=A0A212TIP9_9BACT|nr:hypothetical protein SAMN06265337_1359 [Hymenobacter gelipurpurascens]